MMVINRMMAVEKRKIHTGDKLRPSLAQARDKKWLPLSMPPCLRDLHFKVLRTKVGDIFRRKKEEFGGEPRAWLPVFLFVGRMPRPGLRV
jgi:hypothetical protein